uniref:protein-tyrosine-phosphatase n=1 Tax=Riptortus pedestris TaxID=329032 RepID=R4WR39_RIPPE|nr:m-phase inducer phosphatase [Riptortus pedestris]
MMESPTDIFSCTRLLQSGLRVSTPPGRCGRRFTSDENSPLFRSPSTYTVVVRQRNLLLEDSDTSSQDSAISDAPFRFPLPSGFAPKRTESPRRCLKFSCENLSSLSSDSGISEDGFSELPHPDEDSIPLPSNLGSLLSTNIPTPKTRKRRSAALSAGAKRPKPFTDRASEENKSAKGTLFQYGFTKKAKTLVHSASDSELNIKLALQRSMQEDLIGDFTRPFALPLISGKHQDLKTISSETLAKLINGGYDDRIASFKIIDCRYPYEYAGGHIKGAENLYTCEHILKELLELKKSNEQNENGDGKRNILVFHCEFSSERGPYLSRFLRKEDRAGHEYPQLAYPELYLLHGGYKAFFENHKDLCEPQSYRTMQDPAHSSEYKHFRAKSKSWAPGSHRKLAIRSLSRLNF